jgi:phosphohistidine phosphatase
MLTLALLRHAKSSWDDPTADDADRPLSPRGIAAAPVMAAFMASHEIRPDLVLCSASRRTRETLAFVLAAFGKGQPRVLIEESLYLATASSLLDRVRRLPMRPRCVMVIGHNPGLHDLALLLAEPAATDGYRALSAKFPTAGLAVVSFAVSSWADVGPGRGRLDVFMTPRSLNAHDVA